MDLTTRLALPVNRIAQYEYLLRALADVTEEGSKERGDVENAFAVLAQSSLVVQTSLVQSGEVAEILSVQRKLRADGPISLVKPGRLFLKEFKYKKWLLCLFNESCVIAKLSEKNKTHRNARGIKQKDEIYRVKKLPIPELKSMVVLESDPSSLLF